MASPIQKLRASKAGYAIAPVLIVLLAFVIEICIFNLPSLETLGLGEGDELHADMIIVSDENVQTRLVQGDARKVAEIDREKLLQKNSTELKVERRERGEIVSDNAPPLNEQEKVEKEAQERIDDAVSEMEADAAEAEAIANMTAEELEQKAEEDAKAAKVNRDIIYRKVDRDVKSIAFPDITSDTKYNGVWLKDTGSIIFYLAGEFDLLPERPQSRYSIVAASGEVAEIMLTSHCTYEEAEALSTIRVNASIPFYIDAWRIASFILAFICIWYLRPACALFHKRYKPSIRKTALIWAILAAMVVVGYATYGLAGADHNVRFDSVADSQYFRLAQAFANGQLSLIEEPPMLMKHMMNAYSSAERYETNVAFLWDHAYFDGKYYVYFGVLPVLVYHLPYYLLTSQAFPNSLAVGITMLAFMGGLLFLLNGIVMRWFPKTSLGSFVTALSILVVGSWSFFVLAQPSIYVLAMLAGITCAVYALAFWIRATSGMRIRLGMAAWGSLFCGFTLASRPQCLIVGVFGAILFVQALLQKKGNGPRDLLVFLPFIAVALLVGWYNWARFGNPLDFGATYNLTTNDMNHRPNAIDMAPQMLFYYLIAPPTLHWSSPNLLPMEVESWFIGNTIGEQSFGGILAITPVLLASLFLIGRKRIPRMARIFALVGAGMAIVVVLADGFMAGMLTRYFVDFGVWLALGAAIAQLAIKPNESHGALQMTVTVALAISVWFQLQAIATCQTLWYV